MFRLAIALVVGLLVGAGAVGLSWWVSDDDAGLPASVTVEAAPDAATADASTITKQDALMLVSGTLLKSCEENGLSDCRIRVVAVEPESTPVIRFERSDETQCYRVHLDLPPATGA